MLSPVERMSADHKITCFQLASHLKYGSSGMKTFKRSRIGDAELIWTAVHHCIPHSTSCQRNAPVRWVFRRFFYWYMYHGFMYNAGIWLLRSLFVLSTTRLTRLIRTSVDNRWFPVRNTEVSWWKLTKHDDHRKHSVALVYYSLHQSSVRMHACLLWIQ